MKNVAVNYYHDFVYFLTKGEKNKCYQIAQDFVDNTSIRELYEDLFKKALSEIGDMWECNKISVATEHLASAIIESIMNQIYFSVVSAKKVNKTLVAACVANEYHQIGLKMVCDVFEMNGWYVNFLGANTPTNEITSFTKIVKPDMLAISLSINFRLKEFDKLIKTVRKENPLLPILVGGRAFLNDGEKLVSKYDLVIYKPDLISTELFLEKLI